MPTRKQNTTTKKATAVRKKRVSKKKAAPKKSPAKKAAPRPAARKKPSIQILKLDSVVVINNAKSLYESLGRIDSNTNINIDASAVEMIDTAVLQLLYAFVMKVKASNHEVNWTKPSEEFVSRATLLGLSQHLGIA